MSGTFQFDRKTIHYEENYDGDYILGTLAAKRIIFCEITPCSSLKVTDVSEECIASIFRVEEYAEQKPE
jgi:hypothetical protein